MLEITAALLLAASQPSAAPPTETTRQVSLAVSDKKGRPATDLAPEEIVVLEDGEPRSVVKLARDTRPLALALVVDTSGVFREIFRQNMVDPLAELIESLPKGTRFALWTTGDRPTERLELGADTAVARDSLRRIVPDGGSMLFDTIDEALADLLPLQKERKALVIVTGVGVEFSAREAPKAVKDAGLRDGAVVHAVKIQVPPRPFEAPTAYESVTPQRRRENYERTLRSLTGETGGRYEWILSTMALGHALEKISADINSRYLLTYSTTAQEEPDRLEVRIERPGLRALHGPVVGQD
jgi:VWFA-related protein